MQIQWPILIRKESEKQENKVNEMPKKNGISSLFLDIMGKFFNSALMWIKLYSYNYNLI